MKIRDGGNSAGRDRDGDRSILERAASRIDRNGGGDLRHARIDWDGSDTRLQEDFALHGHHCRRAGSCAGDRANAQKKMRAVRGDRVASGIVRGVLRAGPKHLNSGAGERKSSGVGKNLSGNNASRHNLNSASRAVDVPCRVKHRSGIQVVPAGVVTGQVLSDATGLPFTGATVQVLGASAQDTSDNSGRYSIASNSAHLLLSISSIASATTGAPAMVSVEREVFLQAGVGTVPVDARMTQIAAAIPINATGGSLKNGSITVSVAPGAVSSVTNFHLTSLSQQGLPGLLPLGWSPVAGFDLRADTSTS